LGRVPPALFSFEEKDMGTITFEVRDGVEWATWQTGPEKDTTSDQVKRLQEMADWETTFKPAYEAWKAEQEKGGKKPKDEAKGEVKPDAKPIGKSEPEPDDSKPRYGRK
jgi:hypothetical protein